MLMLLLLVLLLLLLLLLLELLLLLLYMGVVRLAILMGEYALLPFVEGNVSAEPLLALIPDKAASCG